MQFLRRVGKVTVDVMTLPLRLVVTFMVFRSLRRMFRNMADPRSPEGQLFQEFFPDVDPQQASRDFINDILMPAAREAGKR